MRANSSTMKETCAGSSCALRLRLMDEQRATLHDEINVLMEQVMESMGGGTMLIPDPVQRGLEETANPSLDVTGLAALRDDLKALLR